MEGSRRILLNEVERQLDKRPWNYPLGTGITSLGDFSDSYYTELVRLQNLLQGTSIPDNIRLLPAEYPQARVLTYGRSQIMTGSARLFSAAGFYQHSVATLIRF
jgi:hypothetical protein